MNTKFEFPTNMEYLIYAAIWAQQNNLRLNSSKTREMIVSRRGNEGITVPAIVVGAIRVEAIKILGVTLTSDLKIEEHLNKVLSSAASSIYALGTLRSHGLTGKALQEVTRATNTAQVMYASPAWSGYIRAKDKEKLERLVGRLK